MEGVIKAFQIVLVGLDTAFYNILQGHTATFLAIDLLFESRKAHMHLKCKKFGKIKKGIKG